MLSEYRLFSFTWFCTATPQNEWVSKPCIKNGFSKMGRFQRCQKDSCVWSWATKSTPLERTNICLSTLQKINSWIGRFNNLWRQIRGHCFALKSLKNVKFLHIDNFYISQAISKEIAHDKHCPIWPALSEDNLFPFSQFCTATSQNEWVSKSCSSKSGVFSDMKKTLMFGSKHQDSPDRTGETLVFQPVQEKIMNQPFQWCMTSNTRSLCFDSVFLQTLVCRSRCAKLREGEQLIFRQYLSNWTVFIMCKNCLNCFLRLREK